MKIKFECLPCLVNQAVKVAEMTNANDKEELFRKTFKYLSNVDFSKSNPEIIGETFKILKEHIKNDDPYKETRNYYNTLFLNSLDSFEDKILEAKDPFEFALKYAVLGNLIDFNPIHGVNITDIQEKFRRADEMFFTINHINKMKEDILCSNTLLYIGDNCGEICFDKLFIKQIKKINPLIEIYFAARGVPVVGDSIEEDAYFVGIDEYAKIISNGDYSLGTVLSKTSNEFNKVYENADLVISKGQANYESLSEQVNKNIYFLLMAKCEVIAKDIGVDVKSLICMSINKKEF